MTRSPVKRRAIPRTLRAAFTAAKLAGWRVERCGNQHLRWVPSDPTAAIVITPGTPGEYRGKRNDIANLRRSGLAI